MAKSTLSVQESDDLAISTFDIFEMKMSNVLMAKSSLLVFKKGDDFLKHYLNLSNANSHPQEPPIIRLFCHKCWRLIIEINIRLCYNFQLFNLWNVDFVMIQRTAQLILLLTSRPATTHVVKDTGKISDLTNIKLNYTRLQFHHVHVPVPRVQIISPVLKWMLSLLAIRNVTN